MSTSPPLLTPSMPKSHIEWGDVTGSSQRALGMSFWLKFRTAPVARLVMVNVAAADGRLNGTELPILTPAVDWASWKVSSLTRMTRYVAPFVNPGTRAPPVRLYLTSALLAKPWAGHVSVTGL